MMFISILSLFALFPSCNSFGLSNPSISHPNNELKKYRPNDGLSVRSPQRVISSTKLNLQIDADVLTEMSNSRITFWLCAFGATGSAAVGRAAIPKTIDAIKLNLSLAGKPSSGGEDLGLIGYPEAIYREDVEQIINNPIPMSEIVEKYPVPGRMPNMLQYESFAKVNPDANPLAIRAVFDSLVIGINKNSAPPITAEENLALFRTDISALKKNNNIGKAIGFTALTFLLTLIGGADWFAFYHGWHGWFPLWPGLTNFPASLVSLETGVAAIPKYWLSEIPEIPL